VTYTTVHASAFNRHFCWHTIYDDNISTKVCSGALTSEHISELWQDELYQHSRGSNKVSYSTQDTRYSKWHRVVVRSSVVDLV
jgi:hypothetical protein